MDHRIISGKSFMNGKSLHQTEVLDVLLNAGEGTFRVSDGDCELLLGVRGGYVRRFSLNGRDVMDPLDMVVFLAGVLRRDGVKVEALGGKVSGDEPLVPLDLLLIHVSTVIDEVEHFRPALPPPDTLLRVKEIPEGKADLPSNFVRYVARRFGVGMWVPIKRLFVPSRCLEEELVRYLVLTALKEMPELVEVRYFDERRDNMQGRLHELLKRLVEESPDIIGVVVATMDGLPISHYSTYTYDPEIQAAISSAIVALSESSVRDADLGETSEILIVAEKGKVFLYPLGDLVLGVLADRDANTGMIFMKVRRALNAIQEAALKEIDIG